LAGRRVDEKDRAFLLRTAYHRFCANRRRPVPLTTASKSSTVVGPPQRRTKLGRKPKLTEHQKREAIRRRDRDGEPVREIAWSYNVSHSTISRLTA
jgi:hypothetical protein